MHTTSKSFGIAQQTGPSNGNNPVYACVADAGWITGHTYIVYGPLLNGISTFMFESTPMYPDCGRYWDMVQRHKISVFYTAPTAIRSLMRFGDETPKKYDLSSLKVLGTVGEPINPAGMVFIVVLFLFIMEDVLLYASHVIHVLFCSKSSCTTIHIQIIQLGR